MKKDSTYNERLRQENELTKLKIQAEFGAQFHSNKEVNPVIENIWLNNIMEFEKAAQRKETIKLGDKIGNPVFTPVAEIGDENISEELMKVMELLQKYKIVIETTDGASDRELYRFITEELVLEEMAVVDIPNMFTFYIYEEFYPNDDADIRKMAKDFINSLVIKKDDYLDNFLSFSNEEESEVKIQNLKRKLLLFRDAYDDLRLEEFNIKSLVIDDKNAEMKFDFRLGLLIPGNNEFHLISGPGRFHFISEMGFWGIDEVEMSGVF